MKIEDAYRQLPEYMEGGLFPEERTEMERLIRENPELHCAFVMSERLESGLRDQPWLEASPYFTRDVLMRIRRAPASGEARWLVTWERAKVMLSAAALLVMLAFYGNALFVWSGNLLSQAGGYLHTVTGYSLFAVHPVIVLGLIAPLLAGGYATCVLSGRCKLTS